MSSMSSTKRIDYCKPRYRRIDPTYLWCLAHFLLLNKNHCKTTHDRSHLLVEAITALPYTQTHIRIPKCLLIFFEPLVSIDLEYLTYLNGIMPWDTFGYLKSTRFSK